MWTILTDRALRAACVLTDITFSRFLWKDKTRLFCFILPFSSPLHYLTHYSQEFLLLLCLKLDFNAALVISKQGLIIWCFFNTFFLLILNLTSDIFQIDLQHDSNTCRQTRTIHGHADWEMSAPPSVDLVMWLPCSTQQCFGNLWLSALQTSKPIRDHQ